MSSIISLNEFLDIVRSELLVSDNTTLSQDSEFRKLAGWSSLNALLLVSKLNETCGVFISSADLASLTTLGDLYQLIAAQLNGNK